MAEKTGRRRGAQTGPANPFWRGGRSIASNGYVLVRVGTDHHLADVRGYAYEHRLVAEDMLGRPLLPDEQVHHRNGDKADNQPENLEVCADVAHHQYRHRRAERGKRRPDEGNPIVACACGCGATFPKYDDLRRSRRFLSGHNPQTAPTIDAIRAALSEGPLGRRDIVARTGIGDQAVATALCKMRRRREIASAGRGHWQLVPQSHQGGRDG